MVEYLTLLAVPLLTSLLAPAVLEFIKKRINKRREERAANLTEDQHNDKIAAEIRDELRSDKEDLRKEVNDLRARLDDNAEALEENRRLEKKFYRLKKEKQSLEFELILVRQELEHIRRQYEEYVQLRKRAEDQFRDEDSDG